MSEGPGRSIPLPRPKAGERLRLALLGGWSLHRDGAGVPVSSNGQRLLALLALRGRMQRELVAGTLWPGTDDQSALANLRTTLWRVRRRVQGAITGDGTEVGLGAEVSVDVHELITTGDRLLNGDPAEPIADWAAIGHTLARHDPLLPGWYEDWVLAERERLQQIQVHALEIAAERLVQSSQLATALEVAHAATLVEPFRETAHCAVVEVLLKQSNPAQALRHYRRYEQLLDRELGIEPSRRLRELVRPVLGQRIRA
ncbi:AfsR/SARP family transcriptional regulator [Saccharopolyspora sp. MS10]|uniref:AfsR/SARP family transcriptional regulator n=1 Tax=Saccharopolyspora sp. MS10 TaxID=3385973 RepID=UPI00399F0476